MILDLWFSTIIELSFYKFFSFTLFLLYYIIFLFRLACHDRLRNVWSYPSSGPDRQRYSSSNLNKNKNKGQGMPIVSKNTNDFLDHSERYAIFMKPYIIELKEYQYSSNFHYYSCRITFIFYTILKILFRRRIFFKKIFTHIYVLRYYLPLLQQ